MPSTLTAPPDPTIAARPSARLRLAHLTTVDMSLALLLESELRTDVDAGFTVLGISAPGPYVDQVERLGVQHVAVPALTRRWAPGADLRAALQLFDTLRDLDLDILHTHTPKAGVLGRILGRAAGIPVVVNTCHGLWAMPDDPLLRRTFVYALEAIAAQFSDAELYQNADDHHVLRHVVPSRRSRVVGNGIDLRRFGPDPAARAAVRAELGVAPDAVLVLGVGRLVAEKGVAEFRDVADALQDRATFVWAGPTDADERDPMVLDDQGPVRHLGTRDDMERLYAACDAFVLPSRREGFSRSAMEAAASGCAMALSDVRGCREIGEHGREVLLVRAGDTVGWIRAVERLVAEPALRRRLGTAARTRALSRFDQGWVAAASIAAYASVHRRKGRPW